MDKFITSDRETPSDFALVIAANPVRNVETVFRVVCYERDGSWRYVPSPTGVDWRRRKNAQACAVSHNWMYGESTWCVVRKIRVEETEADEGED